MSITDKLRELTADPLLGYASQKVLEEVITAIADRIDAEHKRAVMSAMNDALYHANDESMAELGWVRLPKDADGVPWHINDEFEIDEGIAHVNGIGDNRLFYIDNDGMQWTRADNKLHHHALTVEDVLREFALKVAGEECMTIRTGVVEEFAAKLRLAESEDA